MGVVYLKDKPEADSFSYAYVEDAEGNLVRVSLTNIQKALQVSASKRVEITLTTSGWTISEDGEYYTQPIELASATTNSKVILDPTPAQIIQLMKDGVSVFVGNDNGVLKAYSYNGIPSTEMVLKAVLTTEVV